MKHLLLVILFTCSAALSGLAQKPSPWEKSVVRIEVARKSYDYYQPWNRRNDMAAKTGLVVGKNQILTTAQDLSDHTLVRMQSGGRGAWAIGSVVWVDYYANLAVLTTTDTNFWPNLKPAKLQAKPNVTKAPLQILRWREGKLESRAAEFTQFAVRKSQLSDINQVFAEVSSEIQDTGEGEPLTGAETQEAANALQRLLHDVEPLGPAPVVQAVGGELLAVPAGTDAEGATPAAEMVDGGHGLGQDRRGPETSAVDERSHCDPARGQRQRRVHGDGIEVVRRRAIRAVEVVPDADPVERTVLDVAPQRLQLGDGAVGRTGVDPEDDVGHGPNPTAARVRPRTDGGATAAPGLRTGWSPSAAGSGSRPGAGRAHRSWRSSPGPRRSA